MVGARGRGLPHRWPRPRYGGRAMTRIDAHHHVWDLSVRDQPWTAELPLLPRPFALDELTPELAKAGIDRTVLVQTIVDAAETPELLALAAANPVIAGVVG